MSSRYSPDPRLFKKPELPNQVIVPESYGIGACPWLDDYVQFSRVWSPMSYEGYHEAVGVFLLSAIAARRVAYNFGRLRYTNLYIALVGRTSVHAKTTAAEIGIETLRQAGLDWLLAPDNSTPAWLIKYMSTRSLPKDYDMLTDEMKDRALYRALTAGQRGWFFDEFGMFLSSMMRHEGVMNDFHGILRKLDDTPPSYENATISRDHEVIENPYLALLAGITPADLMPFAYRGAAIWGDGYLARFGLVTPPIEVLPKGRFPNQERKIPSNLITPIRQWHDRLELPEYKIGPTDNLHQLSIASKPPEILAMTPEVHEAYYEYYEALREIVVLSNHPDLDGNYSRFPEKALRISALFASLNNCLNIELSHWAKAQAITERWRSGLHELYSQLSTARPDKPSDEDKVLRTIKQRQPVTKREIGQYTKLDSIIIDEILCDLLLRKVITVKPDGKKEVIELQNERAVIYL
jgi:hypothetical protein